MDERLSYDKVDPLDRFYLHANSVNALQSPLRHNLALSKDRARWAASDAIIHHLQCEIYILRDEIDRLRSVVEGSGTDE